MLNFSDLARPEIHSIVLIAGGLLCLCFRHYRCATGLVLLGASWIFLCATPAFAEWLRRGLVESYSARPAFDYPVTDAIVVLGGGDPPNFSHRTGTEQSNRTGFALELYRSGRAPVIVLSGGAGEAAEMAQQLELHGVPAEALRPEADSMTTYQNAANSARILNREQRRRILLVTSIIPMRRATACFDQQGLQVIPVPIFDVYGAPVTGTPWQPQVAALHQSGRYLHEYVGMLAYRMIHTELNR